MLYLRKSATIVAYTYKAETLCPTCLIESMIANRDASPAARDMNEETVLDMIAEANAIDRYEEWTYDTDDFPKVVFADSVEESEECNGCGEEI